MEVAKEVRKDLIGFIKNKSGEIDKIKDLLTKLNTIDMNLEILQETKLGKIITKFKKNENVAISTLAIQLLEKWKLLVENTTNNNTPNKNNVTVKKRKLDEICTNSNGDVDGFLPINSSENSNPTKFIKTEETQFENGGDINTSQKLKRNNKRSNYP